MQNAIFERATSDLPASIGSMGIKWHRERMNKKNKSYLEWMMWHCYTPAAGEIY